MALSYIKKSFSTTSSYLTKSIAENFDNIADLGASTPLNTPVQTIKDFCRSQVAQTHSYEHILVETTDTITTITLNRPQKKNAMSFAMMRELIDAANYIKKDVTVRAVVIQGAGDDFCAGVDLTDLNSPQSQAFALWEFVKPWQSLFQKVCLVWQSLPVPVIADIHGHCLGAGLQFVMAADITFADKNAKLAVMESKWGLVADMGITQSALGSINPDVLKELAMTARIISADEAQRYGLITHVTHTPKHEQPSEDMCENNNNNNSESDNEKNSENNKLERLLEEIKNRSPDAVLASKRVVNSMYQQSALTMYNEKIWQTKLILGKNRKIALKKAKDNNLQFKQRYFK